MHTSTHETPHSDQRAIEILARSLFRQMRREGYSDDQILGLSTQLIGLISHDLQRSPAVAE